MRQLCKFFKSQGLYIGGKLYTTTRSLFQVPEPHIPLYFPHISSYFLHIEMLHVLAEPSLDFLPGVKCEIRASPSPPSPLRIGTQKNFEKSRALPWKGEGRLSRNLCIPPPPVDGTQAVFIIFIFPSYTWYLHNSSYFLHVSSYFLIFLHIFHIFPHIPSYFPHVSSLYPITGGKRGGG